MGQNTAWPCLPGCQGLSATQPGICTSRTHMYVTYVVAEQGTPPPPRSDLCFPKWVAACWADPDLGDTRAQHLKTQEKDTRQKLKKNKEKDKNLTTQGKDRRYW